MDDNQQFEHALDQILGMEPPAARIQAALGALRAASRSWLEAVWYGALADSRVGPLWVAVGRRGLVAIEFGDDEAGFVRRLASRSSAPVWRSQAHVAESIEQLRDYLAGRRNSFDLPIDLSRVTDFQREVLRAAAEVPAGLVATYGEIAQRIGKPRAARAVGQALAHNPIPIVVPCHRVVAADGSLTGYSGGAGVETKARLLALEGAALA